VSLSVRPPRAVTDRLDMSLEESLKRLEYLTEVGPPSGKNRNKVWI
jgi:hypothetical protein